MTTALPVPYVAAHAEESIATNLTFVRDAWAISGIRLSYTDPAPSDWDLSVLWARQLAHRRGRVQYDEMHTLRQRECMLGRLCQVCQGPALNPASGRLTWVFHAEPPAASGRLSKPPVCQGCLPETLDVCPRLRQEAHVYSSGDYDVWGVKGLVVSLSDRRAKRRDVRLDDLYALEFTLARALVVYVQDMRREPTP